jgi:hypothetical protein
MGLEFSGLPSRANGTAEGAVRRELRCLYDNERMDARIAVGSRHPRCFAESASEDDDQYDRGKSKWCGKLHCS